MGIFDRLYDFGDRELVRTIAMRVDIGLQQIEQETDPRFLTELCIAVANDVRYMRIQASNLSYESQACLNVKYKGIKMSYFSFLQKIAEISNQVEERGGYPIV